MDSYGYLLPLFCPISGRKKRKASKSWQTVYIIKRRKKHCANTLVEEKRDDDAAVWCCVIIKVMIDRGFLLVLVAS